MPGSGTAPRPHLTRLPETLSDVQPLSIFVAYDEGLAARIDTQIGMRKDISTRKMFGGIAWMLNGNMCIGIVKDDLMVRVGQEAETRLLKHQGARPMDFTGRPMAGYLFVSQEALEDDDALADWIGRAEAFVNTLPKK